MWPWRRAARDRKQLAEAEERAKLSKQLAQKSAKVTADFRREVEKNHFTELLAAAMQRGR